MSFNFTNPLPPKPLTGYEVGERVDPETRLLYNNGSEGKGFTSDPIDRQLDLVTEALPQKPIGKGRSPMLALCWSLRSSACDSL